MTDVLVVGAGPTGLMLANQLGRRGVRVTIIDRHSGPARESRAMAVHARTLEIAGPSYYLLRPDGHIGLTGTVFQEGDLKRWLAQPHLQLASSPAPHAAMASSTRR